jgi:hypothetical protein
MSWMNTGFDSMESAYEGIPKSGGGGKRFWMPPRTEKKLLFIDEDPSTFWEHQFFFNGSWKNWEPCHVRNKIGPICPICDSIKSMSRPSYPKFVGLFTVIDMTAWFTKKDKIEINFNRKIWCANMGSKDKPGVLKKMERIRAKHGRLKGLVFDVYRSGDKTESCGDEFTVDQELSVEATDKAIEELRDKMVPPYIKRRNENAPDDKQITMEKYMEWNPWESFNFEDLIQPRKVEELTQMGFGAGRKPIEPDDSGNRGDFDDSGGSDDSGSEFADDDIPY